MTPSTILLLIGLFLLLVFVHELGHAVEESFQEMVYEDSNLIHEFMVKKAKLLEILENHYNLAFSKEDFSQMHTTSRMDEVFEELSVEIEGKTIIKLEPQ